MPTRFQYDVFLSHNNADKLRVRRLAELLRTEGLNVWFDEWVIQPGDDIYLSIERGLEVSRTLVLCLSPAALGSDWVGLERSTVLFRDPANSGRRFIPLLLVDCVMPDTLRRYKYIDFRLESPESLSALLNSFRSNLETVAEPKFKSKVGKVRTDTSFRQSNVDDIQQAFIDFIYGPTPETHLRKAVRRGGRILIVDDEQQMVAAIVAAVELRLPEIEVVKACSGEEALKYFEPGAFVAVVTDIVMPGIDGITLGNRFMLRDPDVVLVGMSGYVRGETDTSVLYEAGWFRFLIKPFNLEILIDTIEMASFGQVPRSFRSWNFDSKNRGALFYRVHEISEAVNSIFKYAKREDHIAHSLLRHKLKHMVAELLRSIESGKDVVPAAETARVQAECLCRLARVTDKASEATFPSFLRQYSTDLEKENPGLNVRLEIESSVDDAIAESCAETVLALVTCELLDNAISAVSRSGRISVDVAHLKSTGQLSIVVRDNGPGIPEANLVHVFQQGFSTKGAGRGLGLHLVQEAARRLGGKVTYKFLKGACFSVVIPLDLRRSAGGSK